MDLEGNTNRASQRELRPNERMVIEEEELSSYEGSDILQQMDMIKYYICPVCLCGQPSSEIYEWGDCHHQFCIDCIEAHVQAAVGRLALPTCPEYTCQQKIEQSTQLYQSLSSALKHKIQKVISYKKILANPNFKPCQSPDCAGAFDSTKTNQCPICKNKHCKQCLGKAHQGECQSRVALQLEMTKKYRQCSRCGQVIEKTEGCTHMTCTCGNYFCYSCGQPLSGEHECQAPEDLNCMQTQRWQIEHIQFWYENASLTLLKILLFFSPPASFTRLPKALWAIGFSLTFYPFVALLGIGLACAATGILLALGFTLTLVVPFTELCGGSLGLCPNNFLGQKCGCCIGFLIVICLYPLIYVINLVQLLYEVIQKEGANILIPVIEILHGVKLILLFPCLMMVDNQQFYLSTANLRQPEPKMLINLSDELR